MQTQAIFMKETKYLLECSSNNKFRQGDRYVHTKLNLKLMKFEKPNYDLQKNCGSKNFHS